MKVFAALRANSKNRSLAAPIVSDTFNITEGNKGRRMLKVINWNQTAERAANMSDSELAYARKDCVETARVWDSSDLPDPDGNAGFYRDESSVYAKEQQNRRQAAAK